jgi:nitrate reductase NapAB chaperone NapD
VNKGHSREPENVPFMSRTLPFIYRFKIYALFNNGKNVVIVEMTTMHFLAKLSSLWVIDGTLTILLFYFF